MVPAGTVETVWVGVQKGHVWSDRVNKKNVLRTLLFTWIFQKKRGFHWRRSQRGIQSWPLGWGVWVKGRSKTLGFRTSTICDAFLIHSSGSHCCCDGCISPRSSWFCDHRRCPWCQQFHGCTCPRMYKLRMSEKKLQGSKIIPSCDPAEWSLARWYVGDKFWVVRKKDVVLIDPLPGLRTVPLLECLVFLREYTRKQNLSNLKFKCKFVLDLHAWRT